MKRFVWNQTEYEKFILESLKTLFNVPIHTLAPLLFKFINNVEYIRIY